MLTMLAGRRWTRTAAATAAIALIAAGTAAPALAGQGHENGHGHGKGQAVGHRKDHGGTAAKGPHAGRSHHQASSSSSRADRRPATPDRPRSSAAASRGKAEPPRHDPVTVCHVLGNGGYHLLTMDDSALKAHVGHGDLYPAPAGGCPAATTASSARPERARSHEKVTVCHLLGNGGYHLLTFDRHALRAHLAHGDLRTVPAGGCGADTAADPGVAAPTGPQAGPVSGTVEAPGTAGTDRFDYVLGLQAARPAAVLGVEAFAAGTAPTGTQAPDGSVLGAEATGAVVAGPAPAAVDPTTGILPQTGGPLLAALLAALGLLAAGGALLTRRYSQLHR